MRVPVFVDTGWFNSGYRPAGQQANQLYTDITANESI